MWKHKYWRLYFWLLEWVKLYTCAVYILSLTYCSSTAWSKHFDRFVDEEYR
jgi:hypothetical protein